MPHTADYSLVLQHTSCQTHTTTDGQTDGQKDRQRLTDGQTNRQMDRRTDRQTDRQTDGQKDRQRLTDGQRDRQMDRRTDRQRDRQSLTDGQRDKQMVDKKDTSITLQTCNEYCTCQSDSKTKPSYTNNESTCNVLITRCVTRQCARKMVPTFFSCNLVQSFAICHYTSVIFLDFSPMRHSTNNLLQMLDLYATALQEQYPKKIRFSDGRVRVRVRQKCTGVQTPV